MDLGFICGYGCEDWLPEVSAEERTRRILEQAHPGFIILVAGCIFIWLKVEFSRYVELKVQFKDGSSRRMLSASITDRVGLYRLYDRLAAALEKFNSNTGDSRENG